MTSHILPLTPHTSCLSPAGSALQASLHPYLTLRHLGLGLQQPVATGPEVSLIAARVGEGGIAASVGVGFLMEAWVLLPLLLLLLLLPLRQLLFVMWL